DPPALRRLPDAAELSDQEGGGGVIPANHRHYSARFSIMMDMIREQLSKETCDVCGANIMSSLKEIVQDVLDEAVAREIEQSPVLNPRRSRSDERSESHITDER